MLNLIKNNHIFVELFLKEKVKLMIKNFIKKIIFYSKLKKIYFYFLPLYFSLKKNYYQKYNQPIFLVSTNRSGSSLITSIIRQHPKLRSLDDEVLKTEMKKKDNHTGGFAEDFIWNFLDNYDNDHFEGQKEGFLWSDPKHISDFYRDDFWMKKALLYEIYKVKSEKIPFVKHTFFTLRLKLVKKIFPDAKIIFNIRSYKDFIASNLHKWSVDRRYSEAFRENRPDIGLHWYLINSIALYHLKKYFKDQHYIFFHEKLYDPNFDNQTLMNELTDFLKIDRFKFSFHNANLSHKYNKKVTYEYNKPDFASEISMYEKKLYEELEK